MAASQPLVTPAAASALVGVFPTRVVVGGFDDGGLPFGLELAGRPWKDGDLLGYAYAYEQATHHRRPPVLALDGLAPNVL